MRKVVGEVGLVWVGSFTVLVEGMEELGGRWEGYIIIYFCRSV